MEEGQHHRHRKEKRRHQKEGQRHLPVDLEDAYADLDEVDSYPVQVAPVGYLRNEALGDVATRPDGDLVSTCGEPWNSEATATVGSGEWS